MGGLQRSIVLIGYRGAGKTVVGRALADRLGRPLVETDQLIDARAGRSIAEIFAQAGERHFRDLERAVVAELRAEPSAVISAGGGVVLGAQNVAHLRSIGTVVWLTAAPEVLWRRIAGDAATRLGRPDLTPLGGLAEVERLLAARTPLYRAAADHEIDTTAMAPADIAERIIELVRGEPSRRA